jgi:hypothetical protein
VSAAWQGHHLTSLCGIRQRRADPRYCAVADLVGPTVFLAHESLGMHEHGCSRCHLVWPLRDFAGLRATALAKPIYILVSDLHCVHDVCTATIGRFDSVTNNYEKAHILLRFRWWAHKGSNLGPAD